MLNNDFCAAQTRGMNIQNQVKRKLSQPAAIEYVAGLLNVNEFIHRSELADFLCEQFGFYDARGQEQRDGCFKALRELEAAGHFTLPAAQGEDRSEHAQAVAGGGGESDGRACPGR